MPILTRAFIQGIGQVEKTFNSNISIQRIIREFREVCASVNPIDIRVINPEPPAKEKLIEALTNREQDVLQAFIKFECSIEAIAADLCIEPTTIKTHINNICQKVGAHSRSQLMAQYIKNPERFGVKVDQQEAS